MHGLCSSNGEGLKQVQTPLSQRQRGGTVYAMGEAPFSPARDDRWAEGRESEPRVEGELWVGGGYGALGRMGLSAL